MRGTLNRPLYLYQKDNININNNNNNNKNITQQYIAQQQQPQ